MAMLFRFVALVALVIPIQSADALTFNDGQTSTITDLITSEDV
jgi:hypothetical protein